MLKRLLDFLIALAALILLSPVLMIVAAMVRANIGSPILFRQSRPGRNGEIFELVKFRTMSDAANGNDDPLPDEARLTRFGKLLRRTSLDELPELWNVLKGEMSIVGPRPLLVEYLDLYTADQSRRHDVRPGITGWAQVNGRNALTWEQKFALDLWYVDNRSTWLDLTIIFKTIASLFSAAGISQEGHATMERFRGNQE